MALMNRRLDPRIETVFMMPAESYSYVSSRLVKEVFQLGGRVTDLVPPVVERRLSEKYGAPIRPRGARSRRTREEARREEAGDGAAARRAGAPARDLADRGDVGEGPGAQGEGRPCARLHGGGARPADAAGTSSRPARPRSRRAGRSTRRPPAFPSCGRPSSTATARTSRSSLRARGGDGRRSAASRPSPSSTRRSSTAGSEVVVPDPGLADVRRGGAGGRGDARSSCPSPRRPASASPPARWRRPSRRGRAPSS